ncbi:MAG: hypothetical protein MUF18_16120 [Fimbriiglobus sp.]|jgi:hypothetical protein|nr:hypothetical protein [Fimbriiglobus sp.]
MAADGRVDAPAPTGGTGNNWLWLNLFRSFQVALDPRKLLAAALGILVMSLGWHLLSRAFNYDKPKKGDDWYSNATLTKRGFTPPTGEDPEKFLNAEGERQFQRDYARWKVMDDLAGPDGKLRTLPWNEFRGKNPYLFASDLSSTPSATWGGQILTYLSEQIPVLTEPLQKLLLPVLKLTDPNASTWTRIYLILCLAWSVVTWAFFGGVITRLAAVQFNGKERTTLTQAVRFVTSRYVSYVLSPTVPLAVVALIVLVMAVYGLFALIPFVGDVLLYGLLFPLIVLGGVAIAVVLLGLVGYPLMYTTISVEGSDTFDAISRSYNYVFQAPWHFLWYWFVSLVYGAAVSFLVIAIGCVMVGLGKGAVSIPASAFAESRKPDFLFVYAPESLGWKELLLRGTPIEVKYARSKLTEDEIRAAEEKAKASNTFTDLPPTGYQPARPAQAEAYMKEMTALNYAGAGLTWFWLTLIFLLMIGFTYSFFWTAATMIYLLMRKKVDEVEIDEVYIEEVPPTPPTPPATTDATPAAPTGGTSLPVVPPPPVAPPPPVPAETTTTATTPTPPPPPAAAG